MCGGGSSSKKMAAAKYETGRFRELNIPAEQYNHVTVGLSGTRPASWINPCAFVVKVWVGRGGRYYYYYCCCCYYYYYY